MRLSTTGRSGARSRYIPCWMTFRISDPARRKALMKKYQSLEAIREATEEDLAQTDSMSPQAARSVYRFFREKERENQPSD